MTAADMPLVSIIIPAHNAADYITATLDSALQQSYLSREIIVVDDGSTDATVAICTSYGRAVQLLTQKNAGPGAARNRGILAAKGELIAFLDADDTWLPDKLERQVRLMFAEPRPDLTFTDFLFEREPGQPLVRAFSLSPQLYGHRRLATVDKGWVVQDSLFEPLLLRNYIGTSTVMAVKSCLVDAGLFDQTFPSAQDRELWLRVAKKYRLGYIDMPLTHYTFNPNSITRNNEKRYRNVIRLLERHYGAAGAQTRALVERQLATLYQDLGYTQFSDDRTRAARCAYAAAMHYDFKIAHLLYWLCSWLPVRLLRMLRHMKQRVQK